MQNMTRNVWIGIGVTVGVIALILILGSYSGLLKTQAVPGESPVPNTNGSTASLSPLEETPLAGTTSECKCRCGGKTKSDKLVSLCRDTSMEFLNPASWFSFRTCIDRFWHYNVNTQSECEKYNGVSCDGYVFEEESHSPRLADTTSKGTLQACEVERIDDTVHPY